MLSYEEVIKKLSTMYNENVDEVEEKFNELEEKSNIIGNPSFIYDGDCGAVEIEKWSNGNGDRIGYIINENWIK